MGRKKQRGLHGNTAFVVLSVLSVAVLLLNGWATRGRSRRQSRTPPTTQTDDDETTETIKIGIIADLQYADRDDGWDYSGTIKRRYRWPVTVLQNAIANWTTSTPVTIAVNLGDTVDGWNAKQGASLIALDRIQSLMRKSELKWRHLLGNHEFYNFPRVKLESFLGYSTDVSEKISTNWRLIQLDSFAVSVIGARSTELVNQSVRYLVKNNPNLANGNMTPGANVWLKDLVGKQRRFTPLNGGLGANQKRWLMQELVNAKRNGEWVVIASHIPIHPSAALDENLMWDYESTVTLLNTHGVGVVALFVAGHDHAGGFAIESQIPFITAPSPLESDDPHRYITLSLTASRRQAVVTITQSGDYHFPERVFKVQREK